MAADRRFGVQVNDIKFVIGDWFPRAAILEDLSTRSLHRHEVEFSTDPRGPRSGSGYVVLIHHHLSDPMRPTREHTATSPHCGLYAVPQLCGSA
jgi:hypothetical protein